MRRAMPLCSSGLDDSVHAGRLPRPSTLGSGIEHRIPVLIAVYLLAGDMPMLPCSQLLFVQPRTWESVGC